MLKKKCLTLLIVLYCLIGCIVQAQASELIKGELYINGQLIETENTVVIKDSNVLIPFRTVLETLGAAVEWDSASGNVTIIYNNDEYICEIKRTGETSGRFHIKNTDSLKYLYLNYMSMDDDFEYINDSMYLFENTGKKILEGLGYKLETAGNAVTIQKDEAYLSKRELYVNNQLIETENTILFKNSKILFPLKTILDAIGAKTEWNVSNNVVKIFYNGTNYICYIKEPNPGYGEYLYMENIDSNKNIYLNPMGLGGGFEVIDDNIYLSEYTGERMLKALNCKVDIQDDSVRISTR